MNKEDPSNPSIAAFSDEFQLAISLHQTGQFQEALAAYNSILEHFPHNPRVLSNLGTLKLQMGDLQAGIAYLVSSLALFDDQPHAHNSLGNAMAALGRFEEALLHFDKAITSLPEVLEPRVYKANALNQLGRFDEALDSLNEALHRCKDRPEWHLLKATILSSLTSHPEALQSVDEALCLRPDFFEGHVQRGVVLWDLSRHREALESYDAALRLNPHSADVLIRRGSVLHAMSRWDEALLACSRAIELEPHNHRAYSLQGHSLNRSGDHEAALQSYNKAIDLDAKDWEAYVGRAKTFSALGAHLRAIEDFEVAIALRPKDLQSRLDRASVLMEIGEFRQALLGFSYVYQEDPSQHDCLSFILYCMLSSLEWDGLQEVFELLRLKMDQGFTPNALPGLLNLIALVDDPVLQRQLADGYIIGLSETLESSGEAFVSEPSEKIRIGYFSSDYREHPVALNLMPVIKAHDRDRYKVIAFDFTPRTSDAAPQEILAAFDAVYNIRDLTDAEAVSLARRVGLDIAVDLNGYTTHSRPGVFQQRVAPLQVNYLGFPGTMGDLLHDIIIADARVIPAGDEVHYAEKVHRLPHFFMPYPFDESTFDRGIQRMQYGLPEDAFIFCSFNAFHKISEAVFAAWMHILKSAENSILYLAVRGDISTTDLQKKIRTFGVDPQRIILAERVSSHSDHLGRLALCDTMLDTYPYNSHTTACDAIAAGLPIMALCGQSFASRVSSSLLEHMGVPDLVARSLDEYRSKAIQLAQDPIYYRSIRNKVTAGRQNLPGSRVSTQNLETLLEGAFKEKIASFGVKGE